MSGIFISYRRDDTAGHAGRLFDHMRRAFGVNGVFMDVDDIHKGEAFSAALTEKLDESDVLLAVIGRQWLTLKDPTGNRSATTRPRARARSWKRRSRSRTIQVRQQLGCDVG